MTALAWILPAVAVSFGLGVLLLGSRIGLTHGLVLSCAGLVVLGGVASHARGAPRRRERTDALLRAAGLLPGSGEQDHTSALLALSARERILRAAGMGEERGPEPHPMGRPSWLRATLCLLGVALVGGGWAAVRAPPIDALASLDGRFVSFRGTASSDLRRFETGWGLDVAVRRLVVAGDGAADAAEVDLSARVWLNGRARPPTVEAGQLVEADGTLRALRPQDGGFDEYLRDRGVAATVEVHRTRVRGPPANPALRLANAVRRSLRQGATAALPRREAELLLGLSVGDTSGMDPEVEEDFRAAGLGHLLAVSGENVANQVACW